MTTIAKPNSIERNASDVAFPANITPDAACGETGLLSRRGRWWAVAALATFALITCFANLSDVPEMGDHECINALAARQTLVTGRWLVPYVSEIPWIRKPPLGTWLIAAASYLVQGANASPPVTDFTARLPSAVAAWGTVLLVYWLGRRMYGGRAGLTSGFIAASCVGIVFYARNAQVDMVLTFFTTLALACFWRGAVDDRPSRWWMAAFYVAFAAAMMAKAPLPFVTVGLSLAVYWFVTAPAVAAAPMYRSGGRVFWRALRDNIGSQIKGLSKLWIIPGVLLFLFLAGLWPAYVYTHFDRAVALWRVEYFDRFTGDMTERGKPLLYYVPILLALTAPFLMSLPEAVVGPFLARYRAHRKGMAFAFTCALVGTCFISGSVMKRPHYLLSLIPAYCLLLGPVIDHLFFGKVQIGSRLVQWTGRSIPLLLALAAFGGGVVLKRSYPGLLAYYIPAVASAVVLWTAACWSFVRDRRTASFVQLNLGTLALLLVLSPGLDRGVDLNREADALGYALRANGVQPDDAIYWVDGRPDSSVEFYSGYHIRRLINEIEVTEFRQTRSTLPEDLFRECERRIRGHFDDSRPVYLILSAKYLDMLEEQTDVDPRIVFQLKGFQESPEDELVVVTQPEGWTPKTPKVDAV